MKNKFIVYLIIILASGFSLSSYCQDGIPEDVPLISYRIFPGQYESDEQFSRFLEFLNEYPDAVDEIALMDENFPAPAGLPLEAVEKLAERLEKRIAELRRAGIRSVGINVAHTLGHWDVPGMDFTPLPPAIGHDGTRSLTCMCHNSPEFRDYIQKKYKALNVARQVRDSPSGVRTIAYELENAPYITLDKSVRTMINECTLALMMGCNGFALNVLNRYEGSLEDFHPHLQAIAAERSRWKTLVDSSSGLPLAGFWPADHPMLMANRVLDEQGWFIKHGDYNIQAPNQLFEMGIPFAVDPAHAQATILAGRVAEAFTTEELRDMLSKSVMLDPFALDVLWERGLGELTGVKPGGDVQLGYGKLHRVAVTERFTGHPLNGPDAGFVREAYTAIPERPGILVFVSEGVIDLSRLIRHDGTDLGSCMTLYTNELGGHVAVSSYAPWNKIGLGPKRRQLIAVADWLSEGRLPVIIDETVRVAPFARQSTDGRVVAVLFNTSLDATGSLTLRLRASPSEVSQVSDEGFRPLGTRVSPGETVVEVPSIPPWSSITLVGY